MKAVFRFSDWLCLAVDGDAATVHHFELEYGAAPSTAEASAAGEPNVAVSFGPIVDARGGVISGGHKSVRWRVSLSAPEEPSLSARVWLGGRPRGLGRMLVQSYFVEPLLSIAASRAGGVLLPGAGFLDEGSVVVIGPSGSGKTSLAIHAMAAGDLVLGDDQVLVDRDGNCAPFPRRLRLYSDLPRRAPRAFDRLPRSLAARLRIRGAIRRLSAGLIAPPLLVERSVLGRPASGLRGPIRGVVILERPTLPGPMRTEPATPSEAVEVAGRLLREQRRHLAAAGAGWAEAIATSEQAEAAALGRAFDGARIERDVAPFPLSGEGMESLRVAVLGLKDADSGGEHGTRGPVERVG